MVEKSRAKPDTGSTGGETGHQDAALRLQESEWRYRLISGMTTDYIFVVDVDSEKNLELLWASDNLTALTGRNVSEANNPELWKNIIHPGDHQRFFSFIGQVLQTTEKVEMECRSFHKLGHERWVRVLAQQDKGLDGNHTQIVGAVREITEQKRIEEQLHRSEQKYRTLHSTMTDAFVSVNMDGVIQEFNESFRQMVGYPAEELKKLTYFDLTPEKWHAKELKIVEEEVLLKGSSGVYEKEYIRTDGSVIPIEIRTFLICDDDGKPATMWAIVRDMTERKIYEERLRASVEEKETLLREVHHRVKNNLQTIISLIQLRSREIKDLVSLGIMSQIVEQVRTISVIYQQLFQADGLSKVVMQTYLDLLTSYLLKTFCMENRVKVNVEADAITLDAQWAMPCGLIINELVTNALKYAFPDDLGKAPEIRISLRKMEDNYILQVSDNGVGLPPDLDWKYPNSVGLQLVNLWATHQMNGKITLSRTNETEFTIIFMADKDDRKN